MSIFKKEEKKVYTKKQMEMNKEKSFNSGVLISFATIAALEVVGGVAKCAWKCALKKKKEKDLREEEEFDADESDEEIADDEPFDPSKYDVEKAFAKASDTDILCSDTKSANERIDEYLKEHRSASVQEEAPSEPVTKADENRTEEKGEVKTEEKKKEIDDDLRDIMNSIEQMPREMRKEISKQIDDGTFVVPDGINISADTLKRLSIFMMNSAISEEEVLEKSEDDGTDETVETNEEKTA